MFYNLLAKVNDGLLGLIFVYYDGAKLEVSELPRNEIFTSEQKYAVG